MTSNLLELAKQFDRKPTRNPWPEDSHSGRQWRKGYEAGQSDHAAEVIARTLRARADGAGE